MQRQIFFLYIILISAFCFLSSEPAKADSLEHADSLFKSKRYTEAFEIYDSLYTRVGLQSSQMLLKMGFIKEGLNDYTNAIYYLNQYYSLSHDPEALNKIAKIAEAHKLKGYKYDDASFFQRILAKYRSHILIFLSSLSLLIACILIYRKYKAKPTSFSYIISLAVILAMIVLFSFLRTFTKKGILMEDVLVYEYPSSGAKVLEQAEKGRMVRIMDEIDVWTIIEKDENVAYVKSTYIKPIN